MTDKVKWRDAKELRIRISEMEAEILRLAHIAEAATAVIAKYDEMNSMRTADHHVDCDCLRCKVDDLKEALSHD